MSEHSHSQSCPRYIANVRLTKHTSFPTCESGMSAAFFVHSSVLLAINAVMLWLLQPLSTSPCRAADQGRYHGGRRPSSDDSFHNPTVIPPSALGKLSIMKRYHRRRTCSRTSPRRLPTMVTPRDTRSVECEWWNDGWIVKTVVT